MQEPLNEPTIEVHEPKECLHLLLGLGHRPFCDSCDFDWIHCDQPMCNYESKVFNLCVLEFAFVMSQEELVFVKSLQDQTCNVMVLLHGSSVDENVVNAHADYSLHNEVLKDLIHHCLEGRDCSWGGTNDGHTATPRTAAVNDCSWGENVVQLAWGRGMRRSKREQQ